MISWVLFAAVICVLLVHATLDDRKIPRSALKRVPDVPERRIFIICSHCERAEQITAVTDETVGQHGQRILCSDCKAKGQQQNRPGKKSR